MKGYPVDLLRQLMRVWTLGDRLGTVAVSDLWVLFSNSASGTLVQSLLSNRESDR